MKSVPRILIIDDLLALSKKERANACVNGGLLDVTENVEAEDVDNPVAEAEFCSGLCIVDGIAEHDLEGTIRKVRAGWEKSPAWALVLLDMHFASGALKPDGIPEGRPQEREPERYFGLRILDALGNDLALKQIPVVIMSAMEREPIEDRFAKYAPVYVGKPLKREALARLLDEYGLIQDDENAPDRIIGQSVALLKCLRDARLRARNGNNNILMLGESGTGKELLARYIHRHSPRPNGPFVTVFLSGIPENLIETELFGHEKGSFTDAKERRAGKAELADGGTLFIDEFGDLPDKAQDALIRLLDKNTRGVQRAGGERAKKVSLQVVMATNKIERLDNPQSFRPDLMHRIQKRFAIWLPPLRERREDVRPLAYYFLRKYERAAGIKKEAERRIHKRTLVALADYYWPDNVRGLETVMEEAVERWRDTRILLPEHLGLKAPRAALAPVAKAVEQIPLVVDSSQTAKAQRVSLDRLIAIMRDYRAELNEVAEWRGRLDDLHDAYANVLAELVRAALEKERNARTGEIQHTPAMVLLAGRRIAEKAGSAAAYSLLKKLLSHHEPALERILQDPVLAAIYKKACQKRPSRIRNDSSSD